MTRNAFYTLTAAALAALTLSSVPAMAAPKGCPPGLAKKSDYCMPPGQSKKSQHHRSDRDDRDRGHRDEHRYRAGQRIERDYVVVRDPGRYGLNPRHTYYRTGDEVFRVDRNSRQVIEFIGLAASLLR